MTIATAKVQGRRNARYETLDELLADAERLSAAPVTTLGNWNLGQILEHIGVTMNFAIDGAPFQPPWIIRVVGRAFLKRRFLEKPLPAGFQMPQRAAETIVPPSTTTVEQGLSTLRQSIARLKSDPTRVPNGILGPLTREEWDKFILRHAELHMSFVAPK